MTFDKPKDVTFTDMAIYIDSHAYTEDCDDTLIYVYLYHLSYMLALKEHYFHKKHYYDDFAIFNANRLYFRIKNTKLPPIKSVLNYIKSTLHFNRIQFEQTEYCQIISKESINEECLDSGYTFFDYLQEYASDLKRVEFKACLCSISKTVRNFLKYIPYPYKSIMWYNIYVSVLLSLICSFSSSSQSTIYDKFRNTKDYIVLYKLDDDMHDYIQLLVNTSKHLIAKDLSELLHEQIYIPSYTNDQLMKELNSDNIRGEDD